MDKCQFCESEIQNEVIECQHHGETLDDAKEERGQPRKGARAKRNRTSFWSWKVTPFGVCIIFLLLGSSAVIFGPSFMPARTISAAPACIDYLRQIDAAKEQWAIKHDKKAGDALVEAEVNRYIRGGRPKCPAGGTYTYGRVGENPRCSIPRHKL